MTELSCIKNDDNELKLIRYVKPKYIRNGEVSDEVFQLREDRSPPEEYISFFHSSLETVENKIKDVLSIFRKRNFSISKTSGCLYLNAFQASKEINLTNEIIRFEERGYPHYGMYYISDDIMDMIEAKSILLHYSELYMNRDHSYSCMEIESSCN